MDEAAAGLDTRPVTAPVAGLFGKLPAHGDFVRRGWADETVDAIDRWLTETVDAARTERGDAGFDAWMRAAPLWRGYVPPGRLGPRALHLALAPSIDRAGRLFPLAIGVAGEAADAWTHARAAGEAIDTAIYVALTGEADADATVARVADTIGAGGPDVAAPDTSAWWLEHEGEPLVVSAAVDAALLDRLLCEGQV